jgi:hypothetical protein
MTVSRFLTPGTARGMPADGDHGTGPGNHNLTLHYPPYWHYDILQSLLVLSRMRLTGDPRCRDALAVLERRRRPDGRWRPGGYWWQPPGTPRGTVEVVDWGRSTSSEMITLNALRILKTAPASATATSYHHHRTPPGRARTLP